MNKSREPYNAGILVHLPAPKQVDARLTSHAIVEKRHSQLKN